MSEGNPQGPERVRSGGFQIDRRRALELLSRYQLESPYLFPLPWARAAVAAGAPTVTALHTDDGFELRFAGRPFTAEELGELLSSLPAEQAEPRLQELARGAIAALGAKAVISVRSGPPGARVELKLAAEGETVGPCAEDEPRTVVGASWPGGAPSGLNEGVEALLARSLPGVVRRGDRENPPARFPSGFWHALKAPGLRGWLAPGRLAELSELHLYKLGVSCGRASEEIRGFPQVRAIVDDPELKLALSQEAPIQDERYESLLSRVGKAAEAFALDAARKLALVLPSIGDWLRDPVAYARWKEGLTGRPESGGGILLEAQRTFALDAGAAANRWGELDRWAPMVGWLRETALRLLGHGGRPATDLQRALWNTPLYLTVEGLPATVEELEAQRLRFGRLIIAERANSGEPRLMPTLEVRDRREMLETLLGRVGDRLNP